MRLWLAYTTVDYEGGTVLGVFSSKELAEAQLEKHKNDDRFADHRCVEELALDMPDDIQI